MKNKFFYGLLIILVFSVLLVSCEEKSDSSLWDNAIHTENMSFGEGEKTIKVLVKADEKSVVFTISTDAQYLGDAMQEHNLVEGEEGEFGLFIKAVNGIRADYDIDGYYWSLEKDGEYLMTGADETEIADGEQYEFIRTK